MIYTLCIMLIIRNINEKKDMKVGKTTVELQHALEHVLIFFSFESLLKYLNTVQFVKYSKPLIFHFRKTKHFLNFSMSVQSVSSPRIARLIRTEQAVSNSYTFLPSPPKFLPSEKFISKDSSFLNENTQNQIYQKVPQSARFASHECLPKLNSSFSPKKRQTEMKEERILGLLSRLEQQEPAFHERKGIILNSLVPYITVEYLSTISQQTIEKIFLTIQKILNEPPPFSVPSVYFKAIFFPQRFLTNDYELCYVVLKKLTKICPLKISKSLIKTLIKRCASASINDRQNAKQVLIDLDHSYTYDIMNIVYIQLINSQVHGMNDLLEVCLTVLEKSTDSGPNSRYEELFCSLKLLHIAPHYHTFVDNLIKCLLELFKKDPKYAHEMRLFILNHWTRCDPPKSVTLMKEATAICSVDPPVEQYVWQRFTWRASSIYMPLALEGLNFVEKTKDKAEGYNNQILRFLLEDAAESHWCEIVRERAKKILELLEPSEPVEPSKLPINIWVELREQAKQNYPDDNFGGRRRKKTAQKPN